MIEIREPFPDWAWPQAWAWLDNSRGMLDDFAPRSAAEFVEYSIRAYARTFEIWKDGSRVGAVGVERNSPAVMTVHILAARRGWGMPAAELRAIAGVLFGSEPALQRIQAFVPAWNRLAISLCRRLGGRIEGTMRSATLRGGKPADAIAFALTREDFHGAESGRKHRRNEQQLEFPVKRDDSGDLLAGAKQSAVDAGAVIPDFDSFFVHGDAEPGDSGVDHGERGSDQQKLRKRGQHAPAAARVKRIRGQRTERADSAQNRAGKAKRARGKPVGRRKQPDPAK